MAVDLDLDALIDAIVSAVPRTQHHIRRAVRRKAKWALDKVEAQAREQQQTVSELVDAYEAERSCSHYPSGACRRCIGRK